MSRWEHTVAVVRIGDYCVGLRCACGWVSHPDKEPTVTRLAQIAQDHRRAANKSSSP